MGNTVYIPNIPAHIANDSKLLDGWVADLREAIPNGYPIPLIIDKSSSINGYGVTRASYLDGSGGSTPLQGTYQIVNVFGKDAGYFGVELQALDSDGQPTATVLVSSQFRASAVYYNFGWTTLSNAAEDTYVTGALVSGVQVNSIMYAYSAFVTAFRDSQSTGTVLVPIGQSEGAGFAQAGTAYLYKYYGAGPDNVSAITIAAPPVSGTSNISGVNFTPSADIGGGPFAPVPNTAGRQVYLNPDGSLSSTPTGVTWFGGALYTTLSSVSSGDLQTVPHFLGYTYP